MAPLAGVVMGFLVAIGVAVFVVAGGVGVLTLMERFRRRQRKAEVEPDEDW